MDNVLAILVSKSRTVKRVYISYAIIIYSFLSYGVCSVVYEVVDATL